MKIEPTFQQVEAAAKKLSASQSVFCVCGRLATGFHEGSCGKFKRKAYQMAVAKIKQSFNKD